MSSFLSSNGRISVRFDNIRPTFSTHAYFEASFHSILSKHDIPKIDFYDAITIEIYFKE